MCCLFPFLLAKRAAQNHSLSFLDAIKEVVREDGDANTNAAVTGALVGCLRGYARLPRRAVSAMPNVVWLEAWTQKLLFMLRLPVAPANAVSTEVQWLK